MALPLFPTFNNRNSSRREIQGILKDLQALQGRDSAHDRRRKLDLAQKLRNRLRGQSRDLDRVLREMITTAARSLQSPEALVNATKLLNPLGRMGRALAKIIGADKVNQDSETLMETINQAAQIIGQLSPAAFGELPPTPPEKLGGVRVEQPPAERAAPASSPSSGVTVERGFVVIRRPGFTRRYAVNDEIITGKMIPVTSSNVHSIGFMIDFNNPATQSQLVVRYLQDDQYSSARHRPKVPGPTYLYAGVHPDLFQSFRRANSKGKFVWDELRIRGTVAGSRYRYTLSAMSQGYVPRRAMVIKGEQWYIPRTKTAHMPDGTTRQVTSRLGRQKVGPYRPGGQVNRGRPNRGRPNRGR